MKLSFDEGKNKVTLTKGKWGTMSFETIELSLLKGILVFDYEDYDGGYNIELPYSKIKEALELLEKNKCATTGVLK